MNSMPLACNMSVFSPAERERHLRITHKLLETVKEIRETEQSYEFVLPNSRESISQLAEFIAGERLCCPFLEFSLRIGPGEKPISFVLSGPEGTKEFLREEFSEAFA